MGFEQLPNGRIVLNAFRDPRTGKLGVLEVWDSNRNARRLIYGNSWDGRDKSRTQGPTVTEEEFPLLVEHFLEVRQMQWLADRFNGALILLPDAFTDCVPLVGDKLKSKINGQEYTVRSVGVHQGRWNHALLLSSAPPSNDELEWMGEAKERNLVDFYADDGHPGTVTDGEDTDADVGRAYPNIKVPTVTYLMIRQEPRTIGPQPFGRQKELKPQFREEFLSPASPQESIRIFSHRMENLFRFNCLHSRAAVADALARWFKRCFQMEIGSLRLNGVGEILYWSQRSVSRDRRTGDDAAVREVLYYVETQEITVERVSNLRSLNRTISVVTEQGPFEHDSGLIYGDLNPYTGIADYTGSPLFSTLSILDYRNTGVL